MRWWLLVAAGCTTPYQRGTMPVEAHPIGSCLDVGVQGGLRPEASGPVVVIRLGNRCDHATLVDLSSVRVTSGTDQGSHTDLVAYDPAREIAPRVIDAYSAGEEWIEYQPGGSYDWLDVDIGRVAGDVATTWVRIAVPK